jgi:crossover junction endodeoxyribonuclease RuvC
MMVLGIDQSLTSTGWCLSLDGEPIRYGIITSDKNKSNYLRAMDVANEISDLLFLMLKEKLDIVVIEGLPFMSRSNVTRDLAGLQFLVYDRLFDYFKERNILVVPPTSLKKFATGSGKASKDDMFESLPDNVKAKFRTTPKTKGRSDITDAYWLARYGEENE